MSSLTLETPVERRCGLLVGGVAVGARSFVADAAALRGADIVSYRSRPLLPRQRRHAEEGGRPDH